MVFSIFLCNYHSSLSYFEIIQHFFITILSR